MASYPSRGGLSSRPGQAQDQVAIHVGKFDFDAEVDGLRGHVKKLKQMSLAIEDEQKKQGELINSLEDTMERAKLVMRRAMGRLNIAYRQAKSNHVLYLLLFAVMMFTLLYVLGKVYRIAAPAASQQTEPKQPKDQGPMDTLELTQEKINAITDKIPERPVGVVEGASYTLIIIAAFGVLAFVLYQVLSSLIFEPTAITAFNAALERLRGDPRITVRVGSADDIRAYGTNSESRVARQQIPHELYKDGNGVEHVRLQFYIQGPSGTGVVNADMYKDPTGQWQYTYLIVDTYPSSGSGTGAQRLAIVTPGR